MIHALGGIERRFIMSHNKNYSKFSQKQQKVNLEEVINEPEVVEEVEDVQEEVVEPIIEQEPIQTIGFVDNCECLRVRKESNIDSEELCIINKLSEVVIDLEKSTDDFYKVTTSEGVDGYCMKKFIIIK